VAVIEDQLQAGSARALEEQIERMNDRVAAHAWQIGTGMIESTPRQLLEFASIGPGDARATPAATAITPLKSQISHYFRKSPAIAAWPPPMSRCPQTFQPDANRGSRGVDFR
jgi:hypothetical protein